MAGGFIVLLGDDSEDDRFFMRRLLKKLPEIAAVHEVMSGQEVIAYLEGEGAYADRTAHPLPHLLILDLKMPCKTGHEVLEWLRSRPEFRMAVIIVSGSSLPADIEKSLALGAADYHKKSSSKEEQDALLVKITAALTKPASG